MKNTKNKIILGIAVITVIGIYLSLPKLLATTGVKDSYLHKKDRQVEIINEVPDYLEYSDKSNYDYNEFIIQDEKTEKYIRINENIFINTVSNDKMTFSLKVDTASYRDIVNKIRSGLKPDKDAIRIEEMINFFDFDKELEENETPFSFYTEIGQSPFNDEKHLAFVRIKTKDIEKENLGNSNYVFLIDTSGSMEGKDRMALLQKSLELLVDEMTEKDTISIVTYAGISEVVLEGVNGDNKNIIKKAISGLKTEGSTAGANGIKTAYEIAKDNFIKDGNNRVIISTDGDFNVGMSSTKELGQFIKGKANEENIYLSILGFGMGNTRHDIMETLSKDGNGNYSYIDNLKTAKKVLVEDLKTNLFTIANDVKTQIAFNPEKVKSYRLIGYENRMLENKDFEDDKIDAGEVGINADLVLMFEFDMKNEVEDMNYSIEKDEGIGEVLKDGLFEIRIRYKENESDSSKLIELPVDEEHILTNNSTDYEFSKAVALFGHILRDYERMNGKDIDYIINLTEENIGADENYYRKEFLDILKSYSYID